jgi:hypothetical protein
VRVWREWPHERRLAALACAGLFLTLFLPWYQETVFANGVATLRSASSSLTGWGAFSFVEAAVLLVAASVLVLLFVRAEGRAFHVPGGDGGVITAAGLWTCALIVWRIFDKQGTSRQGQIAYTSGIEWGIFVALAVAALLAYAGSLIRLAHEPEPPLPGETGSGEGAASRGPRRSWLRRGDDQPRRRPPRAYPGPDMEVDDHWTQELRVSRERSAPPPAPAAPAAPAARPVSAAPAARPVSAAPAVSAAPDPSEAPTRRVRPRGAPDPSEAPTRRVRPRSIADRETAPSEADRRPLERRDSPPVGRSDRRPLERRDSPPVGRSDRRPLDRRPLDRREIQALQLEEPPTARLGRAAPAPPPARAQPPAERDPEPEAEPPTQRQARPRPDAGDDQLTIRLDRPD